jgi:hypothetical protein
MAEEKKKKTEETVDEERRGVLRGALLLPYVVPAITSIAITSSAVYAQTPSVISNDVPPPVNEDDPTNEPDVNT